MIRKVVVPVHLDFYRNDGYGIFAAHSEQLGLTGYGETMEGARESFKRVFSAFIQVARDEGFLEKVLDRRGVEWDWADKYDRDDYEDVSGLCRSQFVPVDAPPPKKASTMVAA